MNRFSNIVAPRKKQQKCFNKKIINASTSSIVFAQFSILNVNEYVMIFLVRTSSSGIQHTKHNKKK